MVWLDQPPSPRAATAPDRVPDMEQRVAGLRREIAEEQASALAVAVQALHPPERSQNMSREALRAVTVLPRCAHGILSAPSQPRRISSARAPMPKRVATSVWEWSGPKPPSNAERVAALRTSLSLPDLEGASAAKAAAAQRPVQLRESSSPGRGAPPFGGFGGEAPRAEAIWRRTQRPASSSSTPRLDPSSLASETGGATTRRAAGGGGSGTAVGGGGSGGKAAAAAAAVAAAGGGGGDGGGGGGGRLEPWADFSDRAEDAPTSAPAPSTRVPSPSLAVAERGPSGGGVARADTASGPRDARDGLGKPPSAAQYPSAVPYHSAALQAAEAALRREARAAAREAPSGVRLSAAPRRLTSLAARRASPVEMLASAAQWGHGPSGLSGGGREGLAGAAAKRSGVEAGEAGGTAEAWGAKEAIRVLARDLALLALGEVPAQLEASPTELSEQPQRVQSTPAPSKTASRAPSRSGRGAPPLAPPWENCPLERKRSLVEWRSGGAAAAALGFLEARSAARDPPRDRSCNFVGAASPDAPPAALRSSRACGRACSRGSSRFAQDMAPDDRKRSHSARAIWGGRPLPWGLERPRSTVQCIV
jgi:hypothetical protein